MDVQCYQIVVGENAQAGGRSLRILSVGEKRKRLWKWSGAGGHDTDKLCNVEAIDYKYKGLIGGILHRGEDEEESELG